jgi:polyhydroxyalkanoate synthesis regulator phasin
MTDEPKGKTEAEAKGTAAQGIRDLIERTFLAGMGAAALTKDRVQELVEEFVRRGQLNTEEGRDIVERLAARSREEARAVLKKADASLHGAYRELGLTSKHELEDLELRLQQLERRLRLLEAASGGGAKAETVDQSTGDAAEG